MNPKDLKEALSLYRKYLVTGWKYRAIAERYGLQITDLNAICHKHVHHLDSIKKSNRPARQPAAKNG